MTLYFGPTFWWFINGADSPDDKHYCAIAECCPVGTATRDGARLICKAGGSRMVCSTIKYSSHRTMGRRTI
jgi:hypothetical protein